MFNYNTIEDLINIQSEMKDHIILDNSYLRYLIPRFNYDDLYVYANKFLCGDTIVNCKGAVVSINSFQLEIFNRKKFSENFLRFLSRRKEDYKLFKDMRYLRINDKSLISLMLLSKDICQEDKDLYESYLMFN